MQIEGLRRPPDYRAGYSAGFCLARPAESDPCLGGAAAACTGPLMEVCNPRRPAPASARLPPSPRASPRPGPVSPAPASPGAVVRRRAGGPPHRASVPDGHERGGEQRHDQQSRPRPARPLHERHQTQRGGTCCREQRQPLVEPTDVGLRPGRQGAVDVPALIVRRAPRLLRAAGTGRRRGVGSGPALSGSRPGPLLVAALRATRGRRRSCAGACSLQHLLFCQQYPSGTCACGNAGV